MTDTDNQRDQPTLSTPEQIGFWLDLEADGMLSESEVVRLEAALKQHPEMRAERHDIARLHEDLAVRVEVDDAFTERVMGSLPRASWERAGRQGWGVAVAASAILALASALLFALAGPQANSAGGPGVGLIAAVAQFLQASVLTGAGLLGASWKGLGLALQQALEASPFTMALFAVGIICLNVLFFRLLRRASRLPAVALERSNGTGERAPRD